ncbi:MAG: hypothetical protein DCC57_04415 [Chloroflexi bacterium]|nr:MAG: hypothetical protein DCC57_04415 [Chloroflexota bacterium]
MRVAGQPSLRQWLILGVSAAAAAIVGVLIAQAAALAIWPEAALFRPLESYARSALFTLVPALIATGLLAWLARRTANPTAVFVRIAVVALLLSFIPDYLVPVPNRTLLASTIAAMLHVVAAAIIVPILVRGYRRMAE